MLNSGPNNIMFDNFEDKMFPRKQVTNEKQNVSSILIHAEFEEKH